MRKILALIIITIIIISLSVLLVSCDDNTLEPGEMPPGCKRDIDNVNDLSILMGKEYIYPASDDDINYIGILSDSGKYYCEVKKLDWLNNVEIYLTINDVEILFELYKGRDPIDEIPADTTVIEVGKLKVYQSISYTDLAVLERFNYNGMEYQLRTNDQNIQAKLTSNEMDEFAASVIEYISKFKLYE